MELIMLVCGALVSTLVAYILHYYLSSTTKPGLLPPGRTGWPVIGESVEFIQDMQNVSTEKFFLKRMKTHSRRAFRTSIVGGHYAVLCGVQGTKFMFGSNSNKLLVRSMMFTLRKIFFTGNYEDVLDTHMKPALLRFIKADALNNSVGVMDDISRRLVQSCQSQTITMYPLVRSYLFALAIRLFLSIEDPEVVKKLFSLMEIATAGLSSMPIDLPGTQLNRAIKAAIELRLQIRSIVEHQRSMMKSDFDSGSGSAQKNLVSYLIQGNGDDDLVAEGILALIFAGFETSSSALCMTFKVLADYPHVYDKVYQENMKMVAKKSSEDVLSREDTRELRYTWNVVLEVLRIYSPVPYITREAIVDFTFEGFHIPKGHKLMASTHALHKDPNFFEDPKRFDPSRFDGDGPLPHTYIPFGGGPFVCSGKVYAQLSILVFVHNVVKKYKWKCMIPNEKIVGIPHPKPDKGLPLHLFPHEN